MSQTGMTSGGQSAGLSKREAADRAASIAAEEILVRNNPTPSAGAVAGGGFSRVRDRQQIQHATQAVAKPKRTPAQIEGDSWIAFENKYKRMAEESERRAEQRVIDRQKADAAAVERKRRLGAFQFQERLLEDVFLRHSASDEDRRLVNGNLAARGLFGDLDATEVELQRVQLEKQ
jgi:hypothetical protein